MLRPETGVSPNMDNVEAIAAAFGLKTWHLLMEDLPDDLLQSRSLEKLTQCYKEATTEGRANIERIAETEVRYSRLKKEA